MGWMGSVAAAVVGMFILVGDAMAQAPTCHVQQGTRTECSGRTEGNSADFTGTCQQVPNMVAVECPKVYEQVVWTLGQAASWCNRNSYDPGNWKSLGASCYYDAATANEACKAAGYEAATSIRQGRYKSPKNNGLTKWEPSQGRFVTYNAKSSGNRRIDGMTCYRYRYVTG